MRKRRWTAKRRIDILFTKHSDPHKTIVAQQEAILQASTLAEVRFDNGRHLVRMTETRGVCKQCKDRSKCRCICCNVALHPEQCFYMFHS
jgi:hypothetical protein